MKTIKQNLTFISEADPNFDISKVEPNIRRAIEVANKVATDPEALRKELGLPEDIRAKYKIELTYGPKRTAIGPNRVAIQLWESGKMFHGGGDELMFFCKDARLGHEEGCWSPISGDKIKGSVAYCNVCDMAINSDFLTNTKIGYITSRTLATVIAKIFHQLESNADIYIKYHKTDMRFKALLKDRGPEVAKRLKGMHIYPLKNLIKDVSAGASLESRIHAFITS